MTPGLPFVDVTHRRDIEPTGTLSPSTGIAEASTSVCMRGSIGRRQGVETRLVLFLLTGIPGAKGD